MPEKGKKGEKEDALQASMDKLSSSINGLVKVFENAEKGVKAEASMEDRTISEKIDTLVAHNEEIARALLLILELNREHLPKISRQTKISSDNSGNQRTTARIMPKPQFQSPAQFTPAAPKMSIPEIELPPLDIEPSSRRQQNIPKKKLFGFGK